MEDRFLSPNINDKNEVPFDGHLRPKNFNEFIGQKKVVQNVEIMVEASKLRKAPMDHILLSGPPGLGKTSLAMIIAQSLGTQLHVISGPALEKKGDLAAILTNLVPGDVLFIDEIHRLHITIEEILYSAMEDFRLDIIIGQGASAQTMQIKIPPFTLIFIRFFGASLLFIPFVIKYWQAAISVKDFHHSVIRRRIVHYPEYRYPCCFN